MMIKICGITRRQDAEAAVEAGASAIGFVLYPKSPRCVTPERAKALGLGLPVWKVGIFVEETAASIQETLRSAQLDIAQIYGSAAPAGARIWRAFREIPTNDALRGAEAVLLDGPANGQGFDWARAKEVPGRVIVAGGLNAANVAAAIRAANPWGVDASSSLELSPGIKDHEKMRRFVEAARQASPVTV